MTPQEQVVAWARSQVGYRAYNGKHNKYAQHLDSIGWIYNGPKDGYDWCDCFADDAYVSCFGAETAVRMINQPKYGYGAGCPWSAQYYRAAGQWSTVPSLGAQIFFGSVGDEYHTGIVVGFDAYNVYTVEGNVGGGGGMVDTRTHYRFSGVAGYGVPNWSLVEDEVTNEDIKKIAKAVIDQSISYKNGIDDSPHTASLGQRVGYIDYDTHEVERKLDKIIELLTKKGE